MQWPKLFRNWSMLLPLFYPFSEMSNLSIINQSDSTLVFRITYEFIKNFEYWYAFLWRILH